jgi:titin
VYICVTEPLRISEYPHKFTSKLKGKSVVEHQEAAFEIDVEAEDAEVAWFVNGKKLNPDDKRVQISANGLKRRLIIKDALLADNGEVSAKTNVDKATANLKVAREGIKS